MSGIECVGIVKACPSGEFMPGTKLIALMGGMGRTINGNVPVSNVVKVESVLPWEELAAIPESFATAWTCLFRNIELKECQTLLIRRTTSSLGQAALNLAVKAGTKVVATTRNEERIGELKAMGAMRVDIERPDLFERLQEKGQLDAVLNLVGNSILLDSLKLLRRVGRMRLAGFLGGLDPVKEFNPLAQMSSGVQFSFFGSFVFGSLGFPLSDGPLERVVGDIARGDFNAQPFRVFCFEQISEAHEVLETNQANGKLVVVV